MCYSSSELSTSLSEGKFSPLTHTLTQISERLFMLSNFLATGDSAFVYDFEREKALPLNQSNSPPPAVFHHLISQNVGRRIELQCIGKFPG